jgi:hypothetical protein
VQQVLTESLQEYYFEMIKIPNDPPILLTPHDICARYSSMKNITLSADKGLIEAGRRQAAQQNTSSNELFGQWLAQYVARPYAADQYSDLMDKLAHVKAGRTFNREKMNE